MSILAKKMTTVSAMPNSYAALGGQLSDMQMSLLSALQPFASFDLIGGKVDVVSGRMKALIGEQDVSAPCFSLGTAEHARLALVQFARPVAQMVSGAKLGGPKDVKADAQTPVSLLDIVLLQPFVGGVLHELMVLMGVDAPEMDDEADLNAGAELQRTGRYVSVASIPGIDENEKWVRLTIPFYSKDEDAKDIGLTVDLFLSAMLADTLAQAVQSASNDLVVDPADPWASHMHETAMQSALPLKVIIEVLNMSVADCTRLELGQTITLPGASHKYMNVSTETSAGLVTLATSTLGVCKSNKAVKLLDDIDTEFLSNIGSVMVG